MRLRFWLLYLLAVPVLLAGTETLQSALDGLGSEDASRYERSCAFLTKHSQEALPALRELFQNNTKPDLARLRTVKLLGELGDGDAVKDMRKVLLYGQEKNSRVRVELIRSLAKLREKNSIIDYFNSRLEQSPNANAAIALALQGDEESKGVLGELLLSDRNKEVFTAVFLSLSETYEPVFNHFQNSGTRDYSVRMKSAGSGGTNPSSRGLTESVGSIATTTHTASANWVPTEADREIMSALRVRARDNDKEISKAASILLQELTALSNQP